jgi:uncharacterized protein (TIGR01319 family)
VMQAAQLLREHIGDLMVLDVGGATTDVHSVTDGDPEVARISLAPEPLANRSVEGDLGVYINSRNVLRLCDARELAGETGCLQEELMELCVPIPVTAAQKKFVAGLTRTAVKTAVDRHVGSIEYLYGPTGRIAAARGKDLTQVQWIIGTGGALTRLLSGLDILTSVNADKNSSRLLPRHGKVLIDRHYIMAAAGLLAERYPTAALDLLYESLGYKPEAG